MLTWLMVAQAALSGTPATPPPAAAPPAAVTEPAPSPTVSDERCLAAFGDLANRPGDAAQAGRYGAMFFYGRLVGREPGLDLAAALPGAARAVAGRLDAEVTRCGRELQAAGHALAAASAAAARPAGR